MSEGKTKKRRSHKPKKQRREIHSLKAHEKVKIMSSHLSKELRKEIGKRALPLRKGDKVKVMRGSLKGKTGKIVRLNKDNGQVFLEGINRKKSDGTEVLIPFIASNLLLTELERGDLKRLKKKSKEEKKEVKPKNKE